MPLHAGTTRRCELCGQTLKDDGTFKRVAQSIPNSIKIRSVTWCAECVKYNAVELEEVDEQLD